MNPNESKSATPAPTSIAPGGTPPVGKTEEPAPRFLIAANSERELALKVARELLKSSAFITVEKTDAEGKANGKYALWNLDDSGKVSTAMAAGITLTAEEAATLPTGDGFPVMFSTSVVLRQLTPKNALTARIAERRVATANRSKANAERAADDDLYATINARRAKLGLPPIDPTK